MIAEHNPLIASLLRGFAERCGFQIIQITEGDRILEFAIQFQPVVIFINMLLPGKIRGFTAIQILREDPIASRIPIVAVVLDLEGKLCEFDKIADACLKGTVSYKNFLLSLAQAGVQLPIKQDSKNIRDIDQAR